MTEGFVLPQRLLQVQHISHLRVCACLLTRSLSKKAKHPKSNANQLKIIRWLQSACQVLKTQSKEVSPFRPLLWKPDRMTKSDWGDHSKFAVNLRCLIRRKKKINFHKTRGRYVEEKEYLEVRLRAADSQSTLETESFHQSGKII